MKTILGERIIVIGSPGAGKSTLAKFVSEKTGIELFHLDRIHWLPGWNEIQDSEFIARQKEILSMESWIIEGNYQRTIDLRLHAADTVLFLDFPRYVCIYRALKRSTLEKNKPRPDMAEGCKEKLDLDFLKWIWNYPNRDRSETITKLAALSEKTIITLRSRKDVRDFCASL